MVRLEGLTEMEVLTRRERGEGNQARLRTSRSYTDIFRQNVFTLINVVLFVLAAVMISIGRVGDALASISLVLMNVIFGVFQEMRAKRKLDQITLLTRPKVTVIREGQEQVVDPDDLVRGDILLARPGDQIVVDGIVVGDGTMEVDESLLTGESDHIPKRRGDNVLSGSFCVTGSARYEARRVGEQSFANRLANEARSYRVVKTPLQQDVDFVIRLLMLMALFLGLLLFVSALLTDIPLERSVQMASVIAGLVPNGLFFMVIVAYAMGAQRIAGRGALVQQSNSVESLSNVDVLCMDKTGTLTANKIAYSECYPIGIEQPALEALLGDFARSASVTNRTSEAIISGLAGQKRTFVEEVTFSSARKWSALAFDDGERCGVYVLGAPEMLQPYLSGADGFADQAAAWSNQGLRVLLFAHNGQVTTLYNHERQPALPPLTPLGLLCFSDELRPEARTTLAGFAQAGIRLKVISGDDPHTVTALARQAGLAGDLKAISGPELADLDGVTITQRAEEVTIFGRITPQQKEKLVESLRGQGYYVAMIGDGVNDVLSLKKANLGIAMQSGSGAARGVADIVLLGDSFAALPEAFLEGQRIISGMRDILRLYVARAVHIVLLILAASVVGVGFPYLPRHIALVAGLTIGIPTFALAVWARPVTDRRRLLHSVIHFGFPAGISVFLFALLIYVVAFHSVVNQGRDITLLPEEVAAFKDYSGITYSISTIDQYLFERATLLAQTELTVFSVLAGLVLVLFVEPPWAFFAGGDDYSGDKRPVILVIVMLLLFALVMAVPGLRRAFVLLPLEAVDYAGIVVLTVVWALLLRAAWRANLFERFLHLDGMQR